HHHLDQRETGPHGRAPFIHAPVLSAARGRMQPNNSRCRDRSGCQSHPPPTSGPAAAQGGQHGEAGRKPRPEPAPPPPPRPPPPAGRGPVEAEDVPVIASVALLLVPAPRSLLATTV